MLRLALPVALSALASAASPAADPVELAQLTIRQRTMIRVPRMAPPPPAPVVKPVEWRERKGPRCIPATALAGAIVHREQEIDLVMRGGGRYRAQIDGKGCHGLNFYSRFYVKPAADGMVCADRDAFRTRSGGACPIDGFKRLEPKP